MPENPEAVDHHGHGLGKGCRNHPSAHRRGGQPSALAQESGASAEDSCRRPRPSLQTPPTLSRYFPKGYRRDTRATSPDGDQVEPCKTRRNRRNRPSGLVDRKIHARLGDERTPVWSTRLGCQKSNPDVFKAVASNKNAIGIIGVSWVSSDLSPTVRNQSKSWLRLWRRATRLPLNSTPT